MFLLLLITINIDVFSYLAFYEILSYLLTFCIKDIWLTFNQISCMQFSRYILTDILSVIRNLKYFFQLYSKSLITGKFSFSFLIWRPPALPHRLQCSTIGRLGLNRRVRDGNGCFPQPHRHQKDSRYLSKCTRMRKRLLEACFHKDFLSGLYKRRSRDWGASLRSALTCLDNSTVKHIAIFYFFFLRKEVIQPHLPIRLPCYDFTPVIGLTFDGCSLR